MTMRSLELHTIAALLAAATVAPGTAYPAGPGAVRAWEGTLDLPTDEEGPPDVNPPFDLFAEARFNYPYTLRDQITGRQSVRRYRALYLENDYLKVVVLPELGGHLYSCVDKATGAEMFYANHSIRKAKIGYRGAWAAFGVEFNFPVSHNWVSLSQVDSAVSITPMEARRSGWATSTAPTGWNGGWSSTCGRDARSWSRT